MKKPFRLLAPSLQGLDALYQEWSAHRTRRDLGRVDLLPLPYVGYANALQVRLLGRVLHGPLPDWRRDGGRLRNALTLLARLLAPAAPGVPVTVAGRTVHTDAAGRWDLTVPLPPGARKGGLVGVEVHVPGADRAVHRRALAVSLGPGVERGVITDVDDTILASGVARSLGYWWNSLTAGPYRRAAITGMAPLYSQLYHGGSGRAANPFFYVSGTSWDLYDLLVRFLEFQGFPPGHLRLKDVRRGFGPERRGRQQDYKPAHLRSILEFYPQLEFLLVGDLSEADPAIYAGLVRSFPGRIPAVWLLHAEAKGAGPQGLEELREACRQEGTELVLAESPEAFRASARKRGWIDEGAGRERVPWGERTAGPSGRESPGSVTSPVRPPGT